jgi:GNAT superfamily N-acetyltransferase
MNLAVADLVLRPARPEDREFAFAVRRAAFKDYVDRASGWDEDEQRTLHERRFPEQDFRVVNLAGRDVGIVAMVVVADGVRVNQLFLLPEHQEHGIGRRCMLAIMEEARGRGVPVRLRVLKVNPRARVFYERLGFVRAGETGTHDLMEWRAP